MHTRLAASRAALFVLIVLTATLLACHKAKPPIARPQPPPTTTTAPGTRPPAPPQPVAEPTVVPPEPARDDAIASASLDTGASSDTVTLTYDSFGNPIGGVSSTGTSLIQQFDARDRIVRMDQQPLGKTLRVHAEAM